MSTRISKTDTADVALYEKVNEIADGMDGEIGYRKPNTEYAVETVRACAYHPEFQLKCTTAGTTGAGELDTSGSYKEGDKIEDGTVVWEITTVGSGSGGAALPLLSYNWYDHKLYDASFLRADTFSWHEGDIYKAVYEHLVEDMASVQSGKTTTWYAFSASGGTVLYTTEEQGEVNAEVVVYDSPDVINDHYTNSVGMLWRDGYIITGKDVYFYRDSARDIVVDTTSQTETIGGITITFYRAEDGHKICPPDQEYKIRELYERHGAAWYYILDTENKKFKLPRTKYGFVGLRDDVGNYVDESLPNITGKMGGTVCIGGTEEGALYKLPEAPTGVYGDKTATSGYSSVYGFNASRSSSTYQDSAPVQQRATQMYLYFYVGNTLRKKSEIDLGVLMDLLETVQQPTITYWGN